MVIGNEKLIDISTNSPNISMSDINDNQYDLSIIPHMYGIPINFENKSNPVIEDCCQALGAKVNNQFVGLKGDINGDDVINVQDVVISVNHALSGTTPEPDLFWAADMNYDNILKILDVIRILNVILG